jgi:hypothetical protein
MILFRTPIKKFIGFMVHHVVARFKPDPGKAGNKKLPKIWGA